MSFIVVAGKALDHTFKNDSSYSEVHKTFKAAQKEAREMSMRLKKPFYILELKEIHYVENVLREVKL